MCLSSDVNFGSYCRIKIKSWIHKQKKEVVAFRLHVQTGAKCQDIGERGCWRVTTSEQKKWKTMIQNPSQTSSWRRTSIKIICHLSQQFLLRAALIINGWEADDHELLAADARREVRPARQWWLGLFFTLAELMWNDLEELFIAAVFVSRWFPRCQVGTRTKWWDHSLSAIESPLTFVQSSIVGCVSKCGKFLLLFFPF